MLLSIRATSHCCTDGISSSLNYIRELWTSTLGAIKGQRRRVARKNGLFHTKNRKFELKAGVRKVS